MLILTRKPGETLRIGDDIEVTIYSGPSHPSALTLFEWQDPA